ncbi:MAG: S-methyl-5-thioribose-1-phosphate isomerase [Chlorobi bacterium CHB2]|nr:S-methyl-5-thioribose-1-phosphate isomerase [Chlorobi bacterium CHB2]
MEMDRWSSYSIQRQPGDPSIVQVIDQRLLPFQRAIHDLRSSHDAAVAIQEMIVRGAPLIGVTGAYGVALAAQEAPRTEHHFADYVARRAAAIGRARPTAVNLEWGVNRVMEQIAQVQGIKEKIATAWATADQMAMEDAATCHAIGHHGLPLITAIANANNGRPVNILTHCNAGRLACVAWGTATAPIYLAHQAGIPLHVWVDETRPRNQGARLTAWELGTAGIPHTLIVDNAGGHLMQHGMVDMVIVGSDRTTRDGDVCNKIGTYLKALAARDNGVPFYVALPTSTLDLAVADGLREIPIEERSASEVLMMEGVVKEAVEEAATGKIARVQITPDGTPAANYGFDITPARLVTGLITERGICQASRAGIEALLSKP